MKQISLRYSLLLLLLLFGWRLTKVIKKRDCSKCNSTISLCVFFLFSYAFVIRWSFSDVSFGFTFNNFSPSKRFNISTAMVCAFSGRSRSEKPVGQISAITDNEIIRYSVTYDYNLFKKKKRTDWNMSSIK